MMETPELLGDALPEVTPQLETIDETETYGQFVAEPLESGYGITLGNALRRVLLSSLPGAAIYSVRIDQVQHEFSTVPGMQEDVTEFLLNVKEIRLQALAERPGSLSLDVTGPREVTAADIQVPADFEIVNPDLHIATLDSRDARLSVEFNVRLGKGYVPAGTLEGMPIGTVPIDAIYSPVRKVNYRVEKTRVGQSTDYDRLLLEIWTDGTITPSEALSQSADILLEQFSLFTENRPVAAWSTETAASSGAGRPAGVPADARWNTPIEDLQLSVRAYNCLKRSGLMTVGQVLEKSEDELLSLRNFGRKSYDELRERLIELSYVDGTREGLVPLTGGAAPAAGARPATPRPAGVILDEEDEEESLGALGKALKEALREVGDDDLLGADDED